MTDDDIIAELDGDPVVSGIGRYCWHCGEEFSAGDGVIVSPADPSDGSAHAVFGGCTECEETEIPPEDREMGHDQYIMKFGLRDSPHGLLLDGDEAVILDRSPADEG